MPERGHCFVDLAGRGMFSIGLRKNAAVRKVALTSLLGRWRLSP